MSIMYDYSVRMAKIRVFFLGTPEFAVPSLQGLKEDPAVELLGLITQPDKPVGRKQILTPSPSKIYALENQIPIYQPERINQDADLITAIRNAKPDFLITVAYGQILKQEILGLAPIINVHGSLLPHYRGPAPINWMIIQGEQEAGLSTMLTDAGIDTGDILLPSHKISIGTNETAAELSHRLASIAPSLLLQTLKNFKSITPIKQSSIVNIDQSKILAPFISKELGLINWNSPQLHLKSGNPKQKDFELVLENSAANIHNLVRACIPWPLAFCVINGQKIQILKTEVQDDYSQNAKQGEILEVNTREGFIAIQCTRGILRIYKVKPESKSEMQASDWINGIQIKQLG